MPNKKYRMVHNCMLYKFLACLCCSFLWFSVTFWVIRIPEKPKSPKKYRPILWSKLYFTPFCKRNPASAKMRSDILFWSVCRSSADLIDLVSVLLTIIPAPSAHRIHSSDGDSMVDIPLLLYCAIQSDSSRADIDELDISSGRPCLSNVISNVALF